MTLQSFFMEKKAEIVDAIRKFAICFLVASILFFVVSRVFMIWEDTEWCLTAAFITNCVCDVSITIMVILVLAYLVILVRDKQAKEVASPLQNLTPEQEEKIAELFRTLPHHKDREDEINMKEVARYLTALEKLGYISPAISVQKAMLRQWVMSVTGKQAPESSPFNQAYPSTNKKGVEEAEKVIKETLS